MNAFGYVTCSQAFLFSGVGAACSDLRKEHGVALTAKRVTLNPTSTIRDHLIGSARRGGITLVLGAGLSVPRGIPSWDTLAQLMWTKAFGEARSPWTVPSGTHSPHEVPQFLPIVFELVYRVLGEEEFLDTLRENLYAKVVYPSPETGFLKSPETLAVVARLLVQEYRRGSRRRIESVVTFNADDLLEQAVNTVAGRRKPKPDQEIVRLVGRSTHSFLGGPLRHPIPLYHIHGFVPSSHVIEYLRIFDHMLVFTDTQYWSTSTSDLSLANRVMAAALGEGRCIFIGLSMTDINLLRWLALRSFEKDRDLASVTERKGVQVNIIRNIFERHFWIRPASDDPSGFLSEFLKFRGVNAIEIEGWTGKSFQALMKECFPP